jgi:Spy/CpxP family protein refolding chaperone
MKRSRKHSGILGAALIAMGLWFPPVFAQAGPELRGPMMSTGLGGIMSPLLLKAVDLTADQQTRIQQIKADHRATLQDLVSQLRAAQNGLDNKLLAPGALQESQLTADTRQISQLRDQLAQEAIRVMLEVRSILTADQLAKAAQLNQQMQALRAQMETVFQEAR